MASVGVKVGNLKIETEKFQKETLKEQERILRSRALQALADVKLTTPVDTGRARNSWYIGYTERYIDSTFSSATILVEKDKPTKIIVTNGTTYIEFLNDGSSKQAPTRFIEAAFSRYFDEVRVETINN
jgi:HK97 gp10 family phage protein